MCIRDSFQSGIPRASRSPESLTAPTCCECERGVCWGRGRCAFWAEIGWESGGEGEDEGCGRGEGEEVRSRESGASILDRRWGNVKGHLVLAIVEVLMKCFIFGIEPVLDL